jgi:hypothetical protein
VKWGDVVLCVGLSTTRERGDGGKAALRTVTDDWRRADGEADGEGVDPVGEGDGEDEGERGGLADRQATDGDVLWRRADGKADGEGVDPVIAGDCEGQGEREGYERGYGMEDARAARECACALWWGGVLGVDK